LSERFPHLKEIDLRTLRLRFEILRHFNSLVEDVLPFVDFRGRNSLAKQIFRCRTLIFHSVKMQLIDKILETDSTEKDIEKHDLKLNQEEIFEKITKSHPPRNSIL
jgi:hypothetical protein